MRSVAFDNGIEIELAATGNEFLGIGRVSADGVALRSDERPMFVEIRNPSGVELCDYKIVNDEADPHRRLLEFRMNAKDGGLMEWMVHEVRNRYNTADWTEGPQPAEDTSLWLEIRPVCRPIGGEKFKGFSYRYRYRSDSIPIYKILDRGTWEIGGCAVGNQFWMRNCFVPAIVGIDSESQFHSTEWYLPSCDNPNILQFLPFQTELQGFSFTASRQGVLITWATQVSHTRSLFEKPRGKNVIVHLHEHCGDLGLEFATPPMEVLWSPGERDEVGLANTYEAARELVHEELHSQIGMRRERVTTYGQIEEWGPADIDRYRELGVPKLLDAGVKTIGLANHFQNNMNTWGVSNMCCTVDYKFAESVGQDRMRKLCEAARAAGARVEMWGNTSVSSLTEIFSRKNGAEDRIRFLPEEDSISEVLKCAKAAWVRNPSRAIEADHYTPVFAVLNLRDPDIRAYWHKCWKHAHDNVGLGGIFLDSSFNLSSDKLHYVQNTTTDAAAGATADQQHLLGHYRPEQELPQGILSQYRAHLDLMKEMQDYGYVYCNEDLGVFGIHRHGPGVEARLDSLFLWAECICNFDVPAIKRAGADPDEVFFRGLAYRMMWAIHWNIQKDALSFWYGDIRGDLDRPTDWHLSLLRAFNEVSDLMHDREILPEERGVLYQHDSQQVLWAFEDLELTLEKESAVRDAASGSETKASVLAAAKHRIYVIRS